MGRVKSSSLKQIFAFKKQSKLSIFIIFFIYLMTYSVKNAAFWDVTPCGSCKKQLSG
jgi:hypothetical protein